MPKPSSASSREASKVMASLLKKGFEKRDGNHHFFYYHFLDGRVSPVKTMVSHSARDIDKTLIAQMSRQCRLSKSDFLDLVDCPLSREMYEHKLNGQGILSSKVGN